MNVAKYIDQIRKNQGRSIKWLSEQCDIKYKTLVDKLNNNRFTADDLFKVSKVLNIDLEKMKEEIEI